MNIAILDRSRMRPDHVSIPGLVTALATAMDLVNAPLANHHKRVGIFAGNIAAALGLDATETARATLAGMLHDIGYLNLRESTWSADERPTSRSAGIGGRILSIAGFTRGLAAPIALHHLDWRELRATPGISAADAKLAQILHLADMVDRMLDRRRPVERQSADVRAQIATLESELIFPDVRGAFERASHADAFWLDGVSTGLDRRLDQLTAPSRGIALSETDLAEFGRLYSIVVDARSAFTATHSWGVAAVVEALGRAAGLPNEALVALELAGQLHDIGKMAVDSAILEKNGPLSPEEFATMRTHAYYTAVLLGRVPGFDEIAEWAGDHHEQLDGNGYPYGRPGDVLPIESKLLAVADRFVAITEDRPYRAAFGPAAAMSLIARDAARDAIDRSCVDVLYDNLDTIDGIRREAQQEEKRFVARILATA